jgi:hypothetical protein
VRSYYTRRDLAGKTMICDQYGWHDIGHAGRFLVRVHTGWSWTSWVPYGRVLEVR